MPPLPSLDDMTPQAWIEAMIAVRERVIDEAASVLDTLVTPELAAPPLQKLFDRYRPGDLDALLSDDLDDGALSIELRSHEDSLSFWVFPSEDYISVVYTGCDHWWFDHGGCQEAASRHDIHRRLVRRIVELMPWANDNDLLEIAAIEIASRFG